MSGYSWMNSFTPTHFGKSALEGGRNYTKNEQEKKNREMKFLNDQKMLEKLTLEVANLPAQQEQNLRLGEAQIGQSLAATEANKSNALHQQLMTALEQQYGGAQRQAGINAQNASAGASYASTNASNIASQKGLLELEQAKINAAIKAKYRGMGLDTQAAQDAWGNAQAYELFERMSNKETQNESETSENVLPPNKFNMVSNSQPVSDQDESSPYDFLSPIEDENIKSQYYKESGKRLMMTPERRKIEQELESEAGKIDLNRWKEINSEASKQAGGAIAANEILKGIEYNYSKLQPWEKGFVFGDKKGMTSAAQSVDTQVQSLVTKMIPSLGGGVVSNADIEGLKRELPSRALNDDSMDYISRFISKANDRSVMKKKFFSENRKVRSADDVEDAWNTFISSNSVISEILKEDQEVQAALERKFGGSVK